LIKLNGMEKLSALIKYWIEHNREHAEEIRRFAEEFSDFKDELLKASSKLLETNEELEKILRRVDEGNKA